MSPDAFTVSVIIPTYNQCALLRETLESVFAQTVAAHEVIVVDDGSTDDTAQWCAGEPRVRYIRQNNAGSSAARNAGLAASSGDFILSLDHDDLLHADYLEAARAAFGEFPEARAAWLNFGVFGRVEFPDYLLAEPCGTIPFAIAGYLNERRRGRSRFCLDAHESLDLFTHHNCSSNSSVVMRRSVARGWNPRLRIADDWGMIMNALRDSPLPTAVVCTPCWRRRVGDHNSGRLGSRLDRAVADWRVLVSEYGRFIPRSAARLQRRQLAELQRDLGYKHVLQGRLRAALLHYGQSFASEPSVKTLWWMLRACGRRVLLR